MSGIKDKEASKKLTRLHLGCGNVYLEGWTNVDIYQEGYTYLADEREDLLEYNRTTIDKYYKYPFGKRKDDFVVVDKYLDLAKIPYHFDDNSIDEILIVGAFEHFSRDEGAALLKEWQRILVAGGGVIIDVPDLIETFELLKNASTIDEMDWAIRLVYGSQKNQFSFHKWGYTFESFTDLCRKVGYRMVEKADLIEHDYPMFMARAIK